jgi:hypothetical protein
MNEHLFRLLPHTLARIFVCMALAFVASSCAASRGIDPSKPRAEAPYPVKLSPSDDRVKAARDAWTRLLSEQGVANPPAATFHPITATIISLPSALSAPLRLPSVGGAEGKEPSDEEMREALRRFLATAGGVLGVQPAELSLVAYDDAGSGLTRAVYRQTPFEFPLRGEFGRVEITFTPDRRITSLSSTAIPEVERLRRAFAALQQDRLNAEKAAAAINGRALTYTDAAGNAQTRNVAAQGETAVRELVVYPVPSKTEPETIELYLAWEVAIGGGPPLFVYVDAFTGGQIAVVGAGEN